MNFELAQTYALLGVEYFDDARKYYGAAIAAEDKTGARADRRHRAIGQLESRLAESRGDAELAGRALARLKNLNQIAAESVDDGAGKTDKPALSANVERASVIGSAYKRKAAIFANRIVAGDTAAATVKEFNNAVQSSIAAYEIGSGKATDERFDPYPALNGLALKALEGPYKQGALECAACAGKANDRFKQSPDVWNAVMAADAYLVESLCSGALG